MQVRISGRSLAPQASLTSCANGPSLHGSWRFGAEAQVCNNRAVSTYTTGQRTGLILATADCRQGWQPAPSVTKPFELQLAAPPNYPSRHPENHLFNRDHKTLTSGALGSGPSLIEEPSSGHSGRHWQRCVAASRAAPGSSGNGTAANAPEEQRHVRLSRTTLP